MGILPHRYLNLHLSGLRTPDEVVTREGDGGGVGGGLSGSAGDPWRSAAGRSAVNDMPGHSDSSLRPQESVCRRGDF